MTARNDTQPMLKGHPRLYFSAGELDGLRALREQGAHAWIRANLEASAEWCLSRPPRLEWIPPQNPDPVYLNLYDRFYGMMFDMGVMEHLSFAYAYSGDMRFLIGARDRTLACCRIWSREADGVADASKAYAVMRLLKGLAVSYDILYEQMSKDERIEIVAALTSVGSKYYRWYCDNPTMGTTDQGPHHASVETASFGITALALLDELPEAADWLALMVNKHVESLLPHALTPDGAQSEGPTFYTSTMFYRMLFLDPLRRVTGLDLFTPFGSRMDGKLALAKISGGKKAGWDEMHRSVIHEPCYGQLNYWSPMLLGLAREYQHPIYQYLALQDQTLGSIQQTRYVTPNGEMLIFASGGYAYAWYDDTLPAMVDTNLPLSFSFEETREYYARAGYRTGDLVAGWREGQTIVHARGRALLVECPPQEDGPHYGTLIDDGATTIIATSTGLATQTMVVQRPGRCRIERQAPGPLVWWSHQIPVRDGQHLVWPDQTRATITCGEIASQEDEGFLDSKVTGLGLLHCADPMPIRYPLITVEPEHNTIIIELEVLKEEQPCVI